ncbi:uncharacterized protein LOC144508712 [Mustelus asterias]
MDKQAGNAGKMASRKAAPRFSESDLARLLDAVEARWDTLFPSAGCHPRGNDGKTACEVVAASVSAMALARRTGRDPDTPGPSDIVAPTAVPIHPAPDTSDDSSNEEDERSSDGDTSLASASTSQFTIPDTHIANFTNTTFTTLGGPRGRCWISRNSQTESKCSSNSNHVLTSTIQQTSDILKMCFKYLKRSALQHQAFSAKNISLAGISANLSFSSMATFSKSMEERREQQHFTAKWREILYFKWVESESCSSHGQSHYWSDAARLGTAFSCWVLHQQNFSVCSGGHRIGLDGTFSV